ncbi:cell division protein FtsL [Bacillus sp. JCM 19046]|uniref:Cell division protein FtsL n=1 Tax=Shouchella xiaoxiensis TaxID=766895 RepID=A0ABS2SRA4_9BACI|nr:septum formation initiator family protein [Shouchella xiaoxiensis]MBM7837551.1 cell division protein FtsL [Shouchella xiaoxiensis]GAF15141.1 cell division protein FtsL [Bacillus sp. JCM 19045]GAF16480.1 cell division protein FtsL [Bacillus sp. JCM 19046]
MLARQQTMQQPQHQPQTPLKEKQVVRYRARITLGEKVIAGFLAVVLFTMLSFVVHNYSTIYGLNLSIQNVEREINTITLQNEGLKTELAEISSPYEVMRQAKELGMKSPGEHN